MVIIPQIKPLHGKFSEIKELLLEKYQIRNIDAVLMDLGTSARQLEDSQRGFSFKRDARLDMRMNNSMSNKEFSAYDVVNGMATVKLAQILKAFGDENYSEEIAEAIHKHRKEVGHIATTLQLSNIVKQVYLRNMKSQPRDAISREQHVATRTFQAIRIFVNDELSELHSALNNAHDLLESSAICAVITFHSLEERIVKQHFNFKSRSRINNLKPNKNKLDSQYILMEDGENKSAFALRNNNEQIVSSSATNCRSESSYMTKEGLNIDYEYENVNSNYYSQEPINEKKDLYFHINNSSINSVNFTDKNVNSSEKDRIWTPVIKKSIRPNKNEIENNPRSKSAKLRAALKI